MMRYKYLINGQVQGVGFRPFIYRLAQELHLFGFVKNSLEGVEVELEGSDFKMSEFEKLLHTQLPPLARIDTIIKAQREPEHEKSFEILKTPEGLDSCKTALISPDIAICKDCLNDIENEQKYKDYFATNCTNCGPRYSIIKTVPYDRANTSMQKFIMCDSCDDEYTNPLNRRYHAQPVSCNSCGPTLSHEIEDVAKSIQSGKIAAIKGLGGFHIVCDASNGEVIAKLREFKNRPTKPFAIMCKDLQQVQSFAEVSQKEREVLESREAPIVILKKLATSNISDSIAPNIDKIGCFLPYTALHHILFKYLQNPIVATSANLGSEPIIIDAKEIQKKLPFIDMLVDFDREILNGVDDSLVQVIDSKIQTLRLSRGYAPKVVKLPFKSEKRILAVGANVKNSIAFVIDDTIILSPHIGDLNSLEAFEFFTKTIESFKSFYNFEPDVIVHDKHPNYETTKWAKEQGKELIAVQHHLAHIYACKAEFGLSGEYLGFSFDGTGYGDDGSLWGGEVFVGDERKYSFKQIKLLGAAKAIKEPRRVALSMLFDTLTLDEILALNIDTVKSFSPDEIEMLHQSYRQNLNAPLSSSVGRIFDAMASFANLLQFQSYEGEAGLVCEKNYNKDVTRIFEYVIVGGVIDIKYNFFDKDIVSVFINTLVRIVVELSKREKLEVILSGGVFQNKTLLELIKLGLKSKNIKHHHQQETAINDGGIALGQAYAYMMS